MDLSREHRKADKDRGKQRRLLGFWRALTVFVTMGVVGLLLGAEPLHIRADGLSESPFRTAALAITGPLATASDFLHLDRPWEWATGYVSETDDPPASTSTTLATTGATTTTATAPGGAASSGGTGSGAAGSSTTSTARVPSSTTTTTEAVPVFTAEEPLRILVVGDSLAVMMGYGLMRQAESNPALKVDMVTKVSSGLSRPDFYNWPKVMKEAAVTYRPDVVVIHFGGNDKQPIRTQGKALESFSTAWKAEYYLRIWAFLDIITESGGEAIWMGLPIMRGDKFSETCRTLNTMYSGTCEHHEGATYVDGYALFQDDQGKYNAYLVDSSGQRRLMRADDGIHFSNAGGDRQAEAVMKVIVESYRLEP